MAVEECNDECISKSSANKCKGLQCSGESCFNAATMLRETCVHNILPWPTEKCCCLQVERSVAVDTDLAVLGILTFTFDGARQASATNRANKAHAKC